MAKKNIIYRSIDLLYPHHLWPIRDRRSWKNIFQICVDLHLSRFKMQLRNRSKSPYKRASVKRQASGNYAFPEKTTKKAKLDLTRSTSRAKKMAEQETKGKNAVKRPLQGKEPKTNTSTRIHDKGYYHLGEWKYGYPSDDHLILGALKLQEGKFYIDLDL